MNVNYSLILHYRSLVVPTQFIAHQLSRHADRMLPIFHSFDDCVCERTYNFFLLPNVLISPEHWVIAGRMNLLHQTNRFMGALNRVRESNGVAFELFSELWLSYKILVYLWLHKCFGPNGFKIIFTKLCTNSY